MPRHPRAARRAPPAESAQDARKAANSAQGQDRGQPAHTTMTRKETRFTDPQVDRLGSCARVAVTGLSARTVRRQGRAWS
ncbi:hypothetical protein SCATT_19570 [Streptantibioticus cattleyicolor NRRL 8057 = DSM 46488]|uniref:Uncharacterized protein n=1 Tax=Streptantibioticus cattleyicolor (strain ATCC 35852 / DSM 46488 / JCM 4925 / NBRC 14057 / NRRL 8057) TaxID=1003195 RepID=G8WTY3_STREN|nr:hypothetical protein SCATT_19570 [Streptantibioticus cattleyicolor NRRL 8057 = DSM 46488]